MSDCYDHDCACLSVYPVHDAVTAHPNLEVAFQFAAKRLSDRGIGSDRPDRGLYGAFEIRGQVAQDLRYRGNDLGAVHGR